MSSIKVVLAALSLLLSSAHSFAIYNVQQRFAAQPQSAHFATADNAQDSKIAVLLCPAQFCVPVDYADLLVALKATNPNIGSCKVAPLTRNKWIEVAKSLPSKAYLDGALPVYSTLSWYFDAIETALYEIYAERGPNVNVCLIGHSIGGWIARAYLGGLSRSSSAVYRLTLERCTSFVTLGTPHSSPATALVDQTRGLLKEVEATFACSSQGLMDQGIQVTCVGSSALEGILISTNIEELVAASSYFPLTGKLGKGDGIVPMSLAFMEEPARRVEVESCDVSGALVRHAHVLPTPWKLLDGSSPSIPLPDEFAWYGSEGVITKWAKFIQ